MVEAPGDVIIQLSPATLFVPGKLAASEVSFPSEIIENGSSDFWTPEYCYKNLSTVCNLDTSHEKEESGGGAKSARKDAKGTTRKRKSSRAMI